MKFIYDEANIMGKLFWAIVELNLKGDSVDLYTRMTLFYWPEWCTGFLKNIMDVVWEYGHVQMYFNTSGDGTLFLTKG